VRTGTYITGVLNTILRTRPDRVASRRSVAVLCQHREDQATVGASMSTHLIQSKRGLQLDRVVLLGRTFEEYRRYFCLRRTIS